MKNLIRNILGILIITSNVIFPQRFEKAYPFRNYNEIVKLELNKEGSLFYTTQGLLKKNYKSNKWTIDCTIKMPNIPNKHESMYTILPNEFESKGFDEYNCAVLNDMYAVDRIYDNNSEIYLFEQSEDAVNYFYYRIVDVKNKYVHSPYYSKPEKVVLNGNYILTKNDYGFSRFERNKEGETKFYFLPYFNEQTIFYFDSTHTWFFTDGGGIQKYNQLSLVLNYIEPLVDSKIIRITSYTNVIEVNNKLIVGCNDVEKNISYLFIIDKETDALEIRRLAHVNKIAMITKNNSDILISIFSSFYAECDGMYCAGGLYRYFLENGSLHKYKEISDHEFVVRIEEVNDSYYIETGQYSPTMDCTTDLIKRKYSTKKEEIKLNKTFETVVKGVEYPDEKNLSENDKYYYGPRYFDKKFIKMPKHLLNKNVYPQLISRKYN